MLLHLVTSVMLLASILGATGADEGPAATPVSCVYNQFGFAQEPLLVTTADGRLFAATAEGWQELFPPAGWRQVKATPDGSIYVYNPESREIWRSADAGATWQPHGRGPEGSFHWTRLYPSPDPNVLLMVSSSQGPPNDRLWRSSDAGATWTDRYLEGDWIGDVVFSPAFAQDATAFVDQSGYHNVALGVYKSTDGGATWALSSEGLPYGVLGSQPGPALSPEFPQDGVAFVGGGSDVTREWAFFKSSDGGATWAKVNNAHAGGPPALSPHYPLDKTLIVPDWGSDGGLFLSQDDGSTLTTIWEQPDTWLIAWGVTLPHTLGAAPPPTPGPYRLYLPIIARGALVVELWLVARDEASDTCYLHRSRDLGASWQAVSLPE